MRDHVSSTSSASVRPIRKPTDAEKALNQPGAIPPPVGLQRILRSTARARYQFSFVAVVLALYLPLVSWWSASQPESFRSTISVAYQDRDLLAEDPLASSSTRFPQIAAHYRLLLNDEAFLYGLGLMLGLGGGDGETQNAWHRMLTQLASYLPKSLHLASSHSLDELPDPTSQPQKRSQISRDIRDRLSFDVDPAARLLHLVATGPTPRAAQLLATRAMDAFIQNAMVYEADWTRRSQDALEELLRDARLSSSSRESSVNRSAEGPAKLDPSSHALKDLEGLREREQDVLDRIQALRASIAADVKGVDARRAILEQELTRLSAKLTPSHPEYQAKQEELQSVNRISGSSVLKAQLAGLNRELSKIRERIRKIEPEKAPDSEPNQPRTENSASLLELEKRAARLASRLAILNSQIHDAALRTRFSVMSPASFPQSSDPARRGQLVYWLLGGCAVILALAGIREFWSDRVRDIHSIQKKTGLPVVGELPASLLRKSSRWMQQESRILQQHALGHSHRAAVAKEALIAYRQTIYALNRDFEPHDRVVLLLEIGKNTAELVHALAEIDASDFSGRMLVIDLNHQNPLPNHHETNIPHVDFAQFLAGAHSWKELRIDPEGDRSYTLTPAPDRASVASNSSLYRAEALDSLFTTLRRNYGHIWIRGMMPTQVVENTALAMSASDVFLICDARTARSRELTRMARMVPPGKLRGVVLAWS